MGVKLVWKVKVYDDGCPHWLVWETFAEAWNEYLWLKDAYDVWIYPTVMRKSTFSELKDFSGF